MEIHCTVVSTYFLVRLGAALIIVSCELAVIVDSGLKLLQLQFDYQQQLVAQRSFAIDRP